VQDLPPVSINAFIFFLNKAWIRVQIEEAWKIKWRLDGMIELRSEKRRGK